MIDWFQTKKKKKYCSNSNPKIFKLYISIEGFNGQESNNNNNVPPLQYNNNNNNNNNANNANNNAAFFQQYHLKNKQMSETSIPSTSADPLNSNSPTPPITSHRQFKPSNMNNNNNNHTVNLKNIHEKIKPKAHSQQDVNHKNNNHSNNQFIQRSLDDNQEGISLLDPAY